MGEHRARRTGPRRPRVSRVACVLGACLALASIAMPAPPQLGEREVQLSAIDDARDEAPAVVALPDGGFVAAYESRGGDGPRLRARRVDTDGRPFGSESAIDDGTGQARAPRLDGLADGRWAASWLARTPSGPDPGLVRARRFLSDGAPLGAPVEVAGATGLPRTDVAMRADGGFVVVWEEASEVRARSLMPGGDWEGAPEVVNGAESGSPYVVADHSRVARGPDGGFVVLWRQYRWDVVAPAVELRARPLTPAGEPLAHEVTFVGPRPDLVEYPDVAALPGGDFVVVWAEYLFQGPDPYSMGIRATRLSRDGAPVGEAFQVNSYTPGSQLAPSVAANDSGGFVVVWEDGDRYIPGIDGSTTARARAFSSDGRALGGELQLNTYTTGAQSEVAVAAAPGERFLAVWQSEGSRDGDPMASVQARTLDLPVPIFGDGFEDGGLGAWTWSWP